MGNVASVQTSPISFVAHGNKGNRRRLHAGNGKRGAEDEHGEWENDKWEQNLL